MSPRTGTAEKCMREERISRGVRQPDEAKSGEFFGVAADGSRASKGDIGGRVVSIRGSAGTPDCDWAVVRIPTGAFENGGVIKCPSVAECVAPFGRKA